jgi:hypothetical protein
VLDKSSPCETNGLAESAQQLAQPCREQLPGNGGDASVASFA